MSEEEKELKHITKRHKFVSQNPLATNIFTTYDAHCLGTVLNLIFKLQKENEELRNFIQNNGMLYRRRDKSE